MSYPLIILGAGASHDYSSKGKHAPLTRELVDDPYLYLDIIKKYNGAGSLLSEIGSKIKKNSKTFEEILTNFQNEMQNSLQLQQQFIALEFYLQELFERISTADSSHDVQIRHQFNNYQILINNIYRYCSGAACIVTFNYDSLLERNLREKIPLKMNDYVQNPIKIFKLHGSHDWVYVNLKEALPSSNRAQTAFEICNEYPNFLNQIKNDGRPIEHIHVMKNYSQGTKYFLFPAIAVPLLGKDLYVCPKNHIEVLERELNSIDRILVIGWKAGDPKLFETIKQHSNYKNCKILVVSSNGAGANLIAELIKKTLVTTFVDAYDGNFTDFMGDELSSEFFK